MAFWVSYLCIDVSVGSILFDELAAWLHVVAHEHGEDFVGFGSILDADLLQQTRLRVHGCLPKLLGIHLTQTFVALRVQLFVVVAAVDILVDEGLSLLFGVAIF